MRDSRSCDGLWLAALFALVACGDDGSAAPTGEPCEVPGMSDFCRCEGNKVGHHTCTADRYWGECVCTTVTQGPCTPGGVSECNNCPGETESRPAVCTKDGNFDCSCTPLGSPDSGLDASPGTDAGQDAGGTHDAGTDASDDDAGDSDAG